MGKLDEYRQLIKNYINYHVELFGRDKPENVEEIAVLDDERGNYQWLSVGWKNDERTFHTNVYARLNRGKIYIEEDWTEEGLGNNLVANNVPKSDIVLAFHSPEEREMTDFAVV